MGYTVISSGPSPYARKVRINLVEQEIPFKLATEVPWNSDTETPKYNPLEKLPVLIERDGSDSEPESGGAVKNAVYESNVILEYLNSVVVPAGSERSLLPSDPRARLEARQVEALADGVADAVILSLWEGRRDEAKRSEEWAARQRRKIDGGLKALDQLAGRLKESDGGFFVGGRISVADLGVGALCGFMNLSAPHLAWREEFPALERYWLKLEERESFQKTTPESFTIKDKVV